MSGFRAKIILHIGQHKTGSKALQSFLARHAQALRQRGVLYPIEEDPRHEIRAYAISQYRMFALLRREAMAACGDLDASACFWAEQQAFCHPFDSVRGMFESLEAERTRIGAGTLLLSAEDLFDMRSAHETGFSMGWVESGAKMLARLVDAFEYDPVVVVYLRRQDHLLGAHYVQYIKGSSRNDLDFESFAEAFAPRLRTRDILAPWASAFDPGRIHVRPYEPSILPLGIVPDFFERALGFPVPTDWTPPPRDRESVNATPDRDHVELIRMVNRGNIPGLPVFLREDVLDAALSGASSQRHGMGIAAWLSPRARRALLEVHAEGNAEIANRFLGRAGEPLFSEPVPQDDEDWHEYAGLSADRAIAIVRSIHKTVSRHRSVKWIQTRRRLGLTVLCAIAGLAFLLGLLAAMR